MRLIMWLGALSGLLFTAARFVAVYLHIHHPGAHEKCCSSLAYVYDFEHADRELRVKAAEMLSPLVGTVSMASWRFLLWMTELLMACGITVDKRDSRQSPAFVASAFRWVEVVMVSCLMWTANAEFARRKVDGDLDGIDIIWIMSTYGSIMQLRFVAHLVWSAVVMLVHIAAWAHVIRVSGWCTGLTVQMVIFVMVSVSSVFLARISSTAWW